MCACLWPQELRVARLGGQLGNHPLWVQTGCSWCEVPCTIHVYTCDAAVALSPGHACP
jgi:hypothetical protein